MKNLLSEHLAAHSILLILTGTILFHLLVLSGVIPFQIVWGGRLQTHAQMLQFETVSIVLNALMVAMVAVKAGYLKLKLNPTLLQIIFGLMAGVFALNTVGNLLAETQLEKLVFTPLTLLLALCCLRLALGRKESELPAEAARQR